MFSWLSFQSLSRPIFLEERRCRRLTARFGWRLHQVEQLDVLIHILDPFLVSLQSDIRNHQQFNESIDISSSSLDDMEATFPLNVMREGSCASWWFWAFLLIARLNFTTATSPPSLHVKM